jgi:hypothetical protein
MPRENREMMDSRIGFYEMNSGYGKGTSESV